jgi:hypothetical protein
MSRNLASSESTLLPQPTLRPATAGPLTDRAVALGAMLMIYGLAYFQRTGIPGTIFDELQHDFALSASAVTALGALCNRSHPGEQ